MVSAARSTDAWSGQIAALGADVRRVAQRLRSLSQARLAAPVPGHPSRAAAGRLLARDLARAAAAVEGRGAATEPAWPELPDLSDFAVGDQVAVTGQDVLAAVDGLAASEPVWAPGGRRAVGELVTEVGVVVAEVRSLL